MAFRYRNFMERIRRFFGGRPRPPRPKPNPTPVPVPTPTPAPEFTAKVRVYRAVFNADSTLNSTFSDNVIAQWFAKVNEIWSQAGIKWEIDSIQDWIINGGPYTDRAAVKQWLTDSATGGDGWAVIFIHHFTVQAAGLYIKDPGGTVYVAEQGSKGPTVPEALAHELGHSLLGKDHERDPANLMNGKAPATELNRTQIRQAKIQFPKGPIAK